MPAITNAAAFLAPNITSLFRGTVTSGTGGTAFDTTDYEGQLLVTCDVLAGSGGGSIIIQTADDSGFSTNLSTVATPVSNITAAKIGSVAIDLDMCRRYIRQNSTGTQTSVSASVTVSGVKKIR